MKDDRCRRTPRSALSRWLMPLVRRVLPFLLVVLNVSAFAQNELPRLAESAPDTYVVQPGDTLWDISALFLNEPWRWPELWRVNPSVRDPNLIYPGDRLYLRWEDGRPGVYLSQLGPVPGVTRLSPQVRSEPLGPAIAEIPRDAIDPFIASHRFVTRFDAGDLPRVIGGYDGRLISGMGDSVYVAGQLPDALTHFDVVRPARTLIDPETREDLGTLLLSVGRVVLSQAAANDTEASRFDVLASSEELRVGDVMLPVEDGELVALFRPRPPGGDVKPGVILSLESGVTQVGTLDVVATNIGRKDGAEVGHIFSIARTGAPLLDAATGNILSLPTEPAGTLMVFAVFERASFGLVLGASRPLAVGDRLVSP